ncbi:hypothetical protein M404DRAFT_34541 [Pisolithus tinctorius Marx 270]|uniref:Uncharacterized protein n=1 Tax=Pisolithus tinctorius Marx 270 TaxID=870435 RepID=A0A0C3N1R3_PISTI|nr:hypothetical protein M404DRAFT_34541 [Pisolithus tinctorius Marx 270]
MAILLHDLAAARAKTSPSLPAKGPAIHVPDAGARRVYRPALPTISPSAHPESTITPEPSYSNYSDADSDSEVGPQPPQAHSPFSGAPNEGKSAVAEFTENEERRRQNVEEAKKPKKLEREEWTLVHPRTKPLISSITFEQHSTPPNQKPANSGEALAKAESSTAPPGQGPPPSDNNVSPMKCLVGNGKLGMKRLGGVSNDEEHAAVVLLQRRTRRAALADMHAEGEAQKKRDAAEEPAAIWDHTRDMDEKQR